MNRAKKVLGVVSLGIVFAASGVSAAITYGTDSITNDANLTIDAGTSNSLLLQTINNGSVGIGTATPNEQLEITGNFRMPATTATTGIIYSGTSPLVSIYGTDNMFFGISAGNLTTTGDNNTVFGKRSLTLNTSGRYNTAIGNDVLSNNGGEGYGGDYNIAVGGLALNANLDGNQNVALGLQAMMSHTEGDYNTAVGGLAMNYDLTGASNTAIGYKAGMNSVSNANTMVGRSALINQTTGSYNAALGLTAGYTNTTGSKNTFLGTNADAGSNNLSFATAIGYGAIVGCGNCMVLGGTGANAVSVGIGTTTPAAKLDINSDSFILETAKTPSSSSASCTTGTVAWDANYVYVCVSSNTWKRSGLVTW